MALIDLRNFTPGKFPTAEDENFEFKSSLTLPKDAAAKLSCAASGFANTGGGCFIWGVGKGGDPDGGIEFVIKGNQPLPEWIDQIIHSVNPPPGYSMEFYKDCEGRGHLDPGKVIAAVSIHPSAGGPHMANDHRYYIRAGRHTQSANHTLVDALWARRQVQKPILRSMLDVEPFGGGHKINLKVVNLTNSPAINIEIDIEPKVGIIESRARHYPIKRGLIDRDNPFTMPLDIPMRLPQVFPKHAVVTVQYEDLAGNKYTAANDTSLVDGLPPLFRED